MSIERLRGNVARIKAETHCLHLSDLASLRKIIMLAALAAFSQACSYFSDPITGYNDPDANNGTIMDTGVDATEFQDANTDIAIIDSDQDLDTAADLTEPNDTSLVPEADTDTILDDFADSYTDPDDSSEGNDAEQDITTSDTPDQDNGDTEIELPLDSDGDGVPNDVDSCPENALFQNTPAGYSALGDDNPACENILEGTGSAPTNCDDSSPFNPRIEIAYIYPEENGGSIMYYTIGNNNGAAPKCVTRVFLSFEDGANDNREYTRVIGEERNFGPGGTYEVNSGLVFGQSDVELRDLRNVSLGISINGENIVDSATMIGSDGL